MKRYLCCNFLVQIIVEDLNIMPPSSVFFTFYKVLYWAGLFHRADLALRLDTVTRIVREMKEFEFRIKTICVLFKSNISVWQI